MATGSTILVVDDDDSILVLMRSLLRQHGFTPLTVSSGEEALKQVIAMEPGLILLDLGLQDIRGEEFMVRLRQNDQRVPVVIISGQPLSEGEISNLGAVDALQKPFEISDLIRTIRLNLELVGC